MKFDLKLAKLSSARTVVFAALWGSLLLPFSGAAMADKCSAATPVGTATGCGVLITVTSVDAAGNAIVFTATSLGNGNPYDGSGDMLVGVQNNSGGNLTSMTLTSSSTPGAFAFDSNSLCAKNPSDCFGSTGYEGPNNTFTNIMADKHSGTVKFTTPIPSAPCDCSTTSTWFGLEGIPQSSASQTVTQPLSPTTTDFFFNTPGAVTRQTIDYTNAGTNPTGTTMQVTLRAISTTEFQNLVAGTFAQGSQCFPQDFGGGNFSCAATIALCTNSSNTTPLGSNCPQSGASSTAAIALIDKYSTNAFVDPLSVPKPAYLAATDNALGCTNDPSNTCRQLHNIFDGIQNDCCTVNSRTKTFNSLFIPVFNLPIWYQPAGTTCVGDAGHQILLPIKADGSSVFKKGSTIQIKFRVCDSQNLSVRTPGVVQSFTLDSVTQGTVTVVNQVTPAVTTDATFHFDRTSQSWIFNFGTKNQTAGMTYHYSINLNDGTTIMFQYGLR
ncbi:MAG: PxKF domain-containing protein [Acidobacteriota bacterium]|nr:PxKF domain-containing protein [Acidobacteriota bacterium]